MRLLPEIMVLLALVAGNGDALARGESSCAVRYLSADHVYLDAGRLAGLEVGATAHVERDGVRIAELLVIFAADHSASCSTVQASAEIRVGDRVVFMSSVPPAPATAAPDTTVRRQRALRAPATATARARAPGPRLGLAAALRWEQGRETGGTGVTSGVLTLPFRIRVRDLGKGWEFRARGSLRRIRRDGGQDQRARSEWRNRIGELALVRDGRREVWHLAAGRVGTRVSAFAGVFDGLAGNRRVGGSLRLGAFAGWAPSWQDMNFSVADRVAGVSLQLAPAGAGAGGLRVLLAGIGRYHEGQVSRENVTMTTTWRGGPNLSVVQAAEIDFNRDWKRDTGAGSVQLTSIALMGRWRANRRLAVSAGFDDREPVRTWETRDRPDSVFQNAGRRGWRAGVDLRGARGRRLSLAASLRTPENGGGDSRSWSARLLLPAWPAPGVDVDLSLRGFAGPVLGGLAPALGLAHRGSSGWYLRAAGGWFGYSDRVGADDRSSAWLGLAVEKELGRHWAARVEGRSDWGEANDLRTLALEARCRF